MKNQLLLILIISFVSTIGCKPSKFTGETTLHSKSIAGTVYVEASGYGKSKTKAVNNSIENAFKNILIHGIPNSNQSRPMLGTNAENIYHDHLKYFNNFFKSDYENFVLSKETSRYKFLNITAPAIEVRLKINTNSLRRHLESDRIIRKLGL